MGLTVAPARRRRRRHRWLLLPHLLLLRPPVPQLRLPLRLRRQLRSHRLLPRRLRLPLRLQPRLHSLRLLPRRLRLRQLQMDHPPRRPGRLPQLRMDRRPRRHRIRLQCQPSPRQTRCQPRLPRRFPARHPPPLTQAFVWLRPGPRTSGGDRDQAFRGPMRPIGASPHRWRRSRAPRPPDEHDPAPPRSNLAA
jgi:hypothetical protein